MQRTLRSILLPSWVFINLIKKMSASCFGHKILNFSCIKIFWVGSSTQWVELCTQKRSLLPPAEASHAPTWKSAQSDQKIFYSCTGCAVGRKGGEMEPTLEWMKHLPLEQDHSRSYDPLKQLERYAGILDPCNNSTEQRVWTIWLHAREGQICLWRCRYIVMGIFSLEWGVWGSVFKQSMHQSKRRWVT